MVAMSFWDGFVGKILVLHDVEYSKHVYSIKTVYLLHRND